jgi:hypothetical protein
MDTTNATDRQIEDALNGLPLLVPAGGLGLTFEQWDHLGSALDSLCERQGLWVANRGPLNADGFELRHVEA